ncbi:uncharacterized protein BCR38DRAFT_55234 [Pseudomassariella vexata]|uniref:RING-type domain-containing protein n=1 Tax=Pseudomassariella vexata TaxID=1141098 RepID=A0A1Y2DNC8_9PEZI|nr:uncharacterized protein BCR38DRAFT_55234 [Pseudomassariella vexata]ORY60165.1 hypothetical protein BCR38DRAFT_55234 [Pseudomassariella vexata]
MDLINTCEPLKGICGHEWCYICLAEYYHDHNALLQCKHKRDCKYFDNPPIYEGDRAFRPFLAMNQRFRPPQPAPPPLFHDWLRPAGPPGGGFPPRRPAPAGGPPPPPPYVPPPPANPNADPFRLALNGFFARGEHANFHVHHARRDNDFMGAAAMFTLGQMVQQAGRD